MANTIAFLHICWVFLTTLLRPEISGWVIALSLGIGIAFGLATQIRNIKAAHIFFGITWIWSFFFVVKECAEMTIQSNFKFVIVFFATGVVGVLAMIAYVWVERNSVEVSNTSMNQATINGEMNSNHPNKPDKIQSGEKPGKIDNITNSGHLPTNTQPSIDKPLPLVVKIDIYNNGVATIKNMGKVPITDLQVEFSSQTLNENAMHLLPKDREKLKFTKVESSSYASGPIAISDKQLSQNMHVSHDLNHLCPFLKFPGETEAEWKALQTTYYVYRFTFRDVRTMEKYACYKVHGSYLKYPSAVNDDSSSAGNAEILQFYDSILGIVIAAAKDHYHDDAKDFICEK
jgi:hypothetical protein